MAKSERVPRPQKKSEYEIRFASRQSVQGWTDLSATTRNVLADAWDFLTRTPLDITPSNYPLKGELQLITRNGTHYQRWQHKPSKQGTARIWFYVDDRIVWLENVHTHHPNVTK